MTKKEKKMSNEVKGVAYNNGDGRFVRNTAFLEILSADGQPRLTTVGSFMEYLRENGVNVPSNAQITMNLQEVDSTATLTPQTSSTRSEDEGFVFLSFMRDDKTGGKIAFKNYLSA